MAWIYNGGLIAPETGMDSFNLMRAFRRIVERGGLARAAEDLGMSPAGLSKQLRTLEAHLGVVLLQRTTRRMSLTETGHAYYRECCRLLDELEALERGIAEQRGDVAGRLRVNAPQSFALSTLSPLLPRFLQQHPQLSLDLVMEDRLLDAVGEGFDAVACRAGRLATGSAPPGLVAAGAVRGSVLPSAASGTAGSGRSADAQRAGLQPVRLARQLAAARP